ncbi:MAG: CocE/NonD family hydrolase [Acidobacteria bacterium]|nr:CocE/NonD family hydrolase [Acidobacteriota bacterium]
MRRYQLACVLFILLLFLASPAWAWPDERPAEFKYTCKEVEVTMRDGAKLAADLYLPEAPGPFPVIIERTPYNKNNCKWSSAPYFAERGYAVLIQDIRGRFRSPGEFYLYRDEGWGPLQDGYDTIEWAGTQSWSNGKVGTMGVSSSCFNQNLTAVTQPPHLKAMFCADSAANWYKDLAYPGGAYHTIMASWHLTFNEAVKPLTENLPDTRGYRGNADQWLSWHRRRIESNMGFWESWQSPAFAEFMEHTTYDDFWKQFAVDEHIEKFNVPAYFMSAWYDRYPQSAVQMYTEVKRRAASQLARDSVKLILGPWLHGGPLVMPRVIGDIDFSPEAEVNFGALRVRWFDYHLKGIDNGIMKEAPIRIFVMGENKWREENEWPIARTVSTRFYLRATKSGTVNSLNDGTLSREKPPAGEAPDSYDYHPGNPVPSIGGDLFVEPMGARDHTPADQRSLTFTSPPLTEDMEITGSSTFEFYASSSANDTDFVVALIDVHPNGYAQILRQNILRASCRESLEKPTPIQPGRVYKMTIPLYPISNLFKKGHRLRVTVTSSSFPKWMPNHNKFAKNNEEAPFTLAKNTLYHDAQRPSSIVLPVVPPKSAAGEVAKAR